MFTGIKDKLLNVKKNVSLFVTDDNANAKSKAKAEFDPRTGASILQHHQDQWEQIHDLNEENARAAEGAAAEIDAISKKISASKTNIDLITHVLTGSNLTTNITQCLNQVKELYNLCESVEGKLADLENLLEDVEFDRMIKLHREHLDNYKTRKHSM